MLKISERYASCHGWFPEFFLNQSTRFHRGHYLCRVRPGLPPAFPFRPTAPAPPPPRRSPRLPMRPPRNPPPDMGRAVRLPPNRPLTEAERDADRAFIVLLRRCSIGPRPPRPPPRPTRPSKPAFLPLAALRDLARPLAAGLPPRERDRETRPPGPPPRAPELDRERPRERD